MKSKIANYLNGKFDPIVLIKTNEKPDDIKGPKAGRGGCVMSFVAQCIAKKLLFLAVKTGPAVEYGRALDGEMALPPKRQRNFRQHSFQKEQIQLKTGMNT